MTMRERIALAIEMLKARKLRSEVVRATGLDAAQIAEIKERIKP